MRTSILLTLLAAGCGASSGTASSASSSSSSSGGSSGGTSGTASSDRVSGDYAVADETWADGKQLSGTVTIAAGRVVELAPGAAVTCAAGTQLVVDGTLEAKGAGSLTGTGWQGISVASGGTLRLTGVDVTGASVGLDVQAGAQARFDGARLQASVPFQLAAGGLLTTTHATVVAGDTSTLAGDFTASRLDYDKGISEGLVLTDPSATLSMEDSTLHGGGGLGDFIVSHDSRSIHVAYTTISGAHCGFHFDRAQHYDIDHVTDSSNVWGAMLYNGEPGPHSITNSNFDDSSYDLDQTRTGVSVVIDGNYLPSTHRLLSGAATVTHPASAPVADARPR